MVVLVVAALVMGIGVVSRFARNELLDTSTYVDTVAPLASDPAVQDAVTNRMTSEIVSNVDVAGLTQQAIEATGIKRADAIAGLVSGPVSNFFQSFVHDHVSQFVHGPRFRELWVKGNTVAHNQVNAILTGTGSKVLTTQGDQVVLNLGPMIDQVKQDLVASGFGIAAKIPPISATFTIFTVQNLPKIQGYVKLFDKLATWLPIIAIGLFGLALWAAPGRRRGALVGMLLVAGVMIALLVVLSVARNAYTNQVANRGVDVAAATAVWDAVIRYLVTALKTLLALSLLAALWLWLAGPGWVGRHLRALVGIGEDWAARSLHHTDLRWEPAGVFLRRWRRWFYLGIGLVGGIIVLFFPTLLTAVLVSVVAILFLLVIGVLIRLPEPGGAEQPPAAPTAPTGSTGATRTSESGGATVPV